MSKFFKTGLAFVGSILMVSTLYAQATIEEVIVTAQRTEQSLQDVPIAVSAFTDEMLSERQIEVASDIQLQVPGVSYTANTFGTGGFAIRGIANFATAASADAGVEVHLNGLPMGETSTNEMGYMDMARIEVLRGPQGTLYGRNSTGGVVNLITARPDLDAFEGRAKIQYGKNNEKQLDLMLNVPISDELGLRVAYNNFEKEGVNKNLYSKLAGQPFDNRDSYMWRATLKWEAADDLTVTLLHSAFDEESSRTQQDGTWCQTGGNLVQGCVMGGNQVFKAIHPISNGSTVPGLLGQTLGFYVPSNLTNGTADEGRIYAPMNGATPLLPQDTGTVPQDFFQSNVWAAPRHDVQESTSQFIIDKDFDNGSLSYAYNDNQRQFYRDTTSLSSEGSGVRWSAGVRGSALYAPSTDPNGEGLPLGYSNSQIAPNCVVEQMKSGIFCPGGEGVRGNHVLPVSGDAFHQKVNSKTHEIKFVSNLDGMFNFLIGGIDISNNTHTYYDVYASGITLNALSLPGSIGSSTRSAMRGAVLCAALNSTAAPCSASAVAAGNGLLQNPAVIAGATAATAGITAAGGSGTVTPFDLANDMISRIDGLYTEHFHNVTDAYKLDSSAIFTEFYFDINERHRLTAGLRYNEDTKSVSVNATFYKVPVISNWNTGATLGGTGLAGDCGFDLTTGRAKSATYTAVPGTGGAFNSTTDNAACFNAGLDSAGARTVGQQIGMFPGGTVAQGTTNGSAPLGVLPANNADYDQFGIPTIKDFSETTGRLVWDFQINDDTLFYMSYAKGFKGGGFNPPFNASQFPDTPFTFESTGVDSIEFGVKAAVPEVGLIANASVYYNDFKNFHIGVIRNETAINTGMPLENMGAELELYLTPPSVPGLSFNMMMSYATSEIGTFSMINPHDLGGHYRKQASTGNMDGYTDWHVAKNFTANSFLIAKEAMGTTYGRILDVQFAPVFAAMAVGGTVGDGGAGDAAAATANAGLAASNEIYRALHCTAGDGGTIAANSCGTKKALTASDVNSTMIPFESSAAAVGYGNLGQVCHNFASAGGVNSCFPAALGGTAAVAPTASLIYGGAEANATNTNSLTGMLLPSLVNRATGTDLQTGGICGLFQAMVDHAGDVTRNNELSLATGEVCASTVVDGVTVKGKFLSSGLEQNLTGNEMPYPELTLSMGLAYTFQTNNLEVTPRLDYYYQSDAYSSVFNIEAQKIKAWDEINFSLMIVPTDADWNVRFWAQNLTDDRNITGSSVGNSSVGHTTGVFVREGRSFGMSFGIGF